MDFELSADQLALRDAAVDLLRTLSSTDRVRKMFGAPEGYDVELWREMVAQGWPAIAVPEQQGGLGLSLVESTILAEQVGRHVAPAPFLSTVLALRALTAAGDELAERLLAGGVGAVAWGSGPVVDLPVADVLVSVEDSGVTAFDISERRPAAQPGMDLTRRLGWLPADLGGGRPLGDAELATDLLDAGATLVSAELLGGADRMLEASVEYAKVREQFGRPIGSFQAVKHRCADMYVDVEGMRSAVYYAAMAVADGAPDASLAASTAKSWCGDAGRRVIASALQVHGGIGFTWEHDLHLYLKRAQLDARRFGDPAWHRERIVRLLRDRLAAGESVF